MKTFNLHDMFEPIALDERPVDSDSDSDSDAAPSAKPKPKAAPKPAPKKAADSNRMRCPLDRK